MFILMLGHDEFNVGGNGDVPNCGGATGAVVSRGQKNQTFVTKLKAIACQAFLSTRLLSDLKGGWEQLGSLL